METTYMLGQSTYLDYYTGPKKCRLMMCPECKTTLKRDDKKWMHVIIGLDERSLALYYCPNPQCTRWELPILKNLETDSPHKGPVVENNIDLIESVYA